MAESSIAGLFQDPLLYQQAQDQAAFKRFAEMAQLDPLQQAQASLMYGGYQLGGALGRGLGGEDPMLKQISARNSLLSGVDWSSQASVEQAMQQAMQNKDPKTALVIRDEFLKQRKTIAETQAKIAEKRPEQLKVAEAIVSQRGVDITTPEGKQAVSKELERLTTKEGKQPEIEQLQNYRDRLVTEYGENDPRVKQVDAAITKVTKSKMSLEEALSSGLGVIGAAIAGQQAKSAAAASGTDVGKKIADIEGSQSALEAIQGAKKIFNKGIYSGKYGPTMENIAGYTEGVVGSKERLANTEEFRAYLGDVVIPGLKDFGGSDTVEELKYLQAVYAGDTSAQPQALKSMLNRAEKKISSKIKRIQDQQAAIEKGKPLPTGPSMSQNIRVWNPKTRQFESQ